MNSNHWFIKCCIFGIVYYRSIDSIVRNNRTKLHKIMLEYNIFYSRFSRILYSRILFSLALSKDEGWFLTCYCLSVYSKEDHRNFRKRKRHCPFILPISGRYLAAEASPPHSSRGCDQLVSNDFHPHQTARQRVSFSFNAGIWATSHSQNLPVVNTTIRPPIRPP